MRAEAHNVTFPHILGVSKQRPATSYLITNNTKYAYIYVDFRGAAARAAFNTSGIFNGQLVLIPFASFDLDTGDILNDLDFIGLSTPNDF